MAGGISRALSGGSVLHVSIKLSWITIAIFNLSLSYYLVTEICHRDNCQEWIFIIKGMVIFYQNLGSWATGPLLVFFPVPPYKVFGKKKKNSKKYRRALVVLMGIEPTIIQAQSNFITKCVSEVTTWLSQYRELRVIFYVYTVKRTIFTLICRCTWPYIYIVPFTCSDNVTRNQQRPLSWHVYILLYTSTCN